MPAAMAPPSRMRPSSGRNSSATPPTPSTAATASRALSGWPKNIRMPIGLMMTIVENTTATSPDETCVSAR